MRRADLTIVCSIIVIVAGLFVAWWAPDTASTIEAAAGYAIAGVGVLGLVWGVVLWARRGPAGPRPDEDRAGP